MINNLDKSVRTKYGTVAKKYEEYIGKIVRVYQLGATHVGRLVHGDYNEIILLPSVVSIGSAKESVLIINNDLPTICFHSSIQSIEPLPVNESYLEKLVADCAENEKTRLEKEKLELAKLQCEFYKSKDVK